MKNIIRRTRVRSIQAWLWVSGVVIDSQYDTLYAVKVLVQSSVLLFSLL